MDIPSTNSGKGTFTKYDSKSDACKLGSDENDESSGVLKMGQTFYDLQNSQ